MFAAIREHLWIAWSGLLRRWPKLDHSRAYWDVLVTQWNKHLFETTSPFGVAFLIWWITGNPPVSFILCAVVWAFLLAGYSAWRAKYIRLIPQFELNEFRLHQPTTVDPALKKLYLQILPKCITNTRVKRCKGYLLRVMKWSETDREWQSTEYDQPLDLIWSFYDSRPRDLEFGINQWLNLFWVSDREQHLHLETNPTPVAESSVLTFADKYRFDIRVTAKGCPARDMSLIARVGTACNTLTVEKA